MKSVDETGMPLPGEFEWKPGSVWLKPSRLPRLFLPICPPTPCSLEGAMHSPRGQPGESKSLDPCCHLLEKETTFHHAVMTFSIDIVTDLCCLSIRSLFIRNNTPNLELHLIIIFPVMSRVSRQCRTSIIVEQLISFLVNPSS